MRKLQDLLQEAQFSQPQQAKLIEFRLKQFENHSKRIESFSLEVAIKIESEKLRIMDIKLAALSQVIRSGELWH